MFPHNSDGTNLSAEVPPFVPRKDWTNEQAAHHPPSPLPRYVTTCYPFVQEQQDRRHVMIPPHLQNVGVNPNARWSGQPIFPPSFVAPSLPTARAIPHNINVVGYGDVPGNIADSLQTTAVYGASLQPLQTLAQSNQQYRKKSGEKQNSKKVTKRNVGTQKEVGMHGPDLNDDPPTMVDNCQQTDFPISVASKSLTDRPSPLRKASRSRRQRRVAAVERSSNSYSDHDDADVDSDSGYYSPKRRLGQRGNGGGRPGEQVNTSLQPVVLIPPPGNPPSSVVYQTYLSASPQLHSNVLSPHVTPPPPPSSVINNIPITSRPPPGFPMPPQPMQMSTGWMWNNTQYMPPNYASQPPAPVPSTSYQKGATKGHRKNPPAHEKKRPNRVDQPVNSSLNQNARYNGNKLDWKSNSNSSQGSNRHQNQPRNVVYNQPSQLSQPMPQAPEHPFYLEDAQEFPGLGGAPLVHAQTSAPKLSYRQALARNPAERVPAHAQTIQQQANSSGKTSKSPEDAAGREKAQKTRKRWKKAERASKAADEEYAEISQEHENIKKALRKTANSRSRNKTPMLDLGEIFSKLETKSANPKHPSGKKVVQIGGGIGHEITSTSAHKSRLAVPVNPLDSTAPLQKRGKERETPKVKKPSALKKVILKEREEKKEQRLQQLSTLSGPDHDVPPYPSAMLNPPPLANASESNEDEPTVEVKLGQLTVDDVPANVPQIHSRRYREYCCQVLDKKIDETCTIILQKLVQFQDRLYQKDPTKAKMRRRLVMGLREVTKHLKLKKLKCVIISPNLEKIQSKGGLDDALQQILNSCEEQNVTYIFALGRKAMGRAVSKLVPVSIVGIFDYSGVEDHYKQLVELVADAQTKYKEMVSIYHQEIVEANTPSVPVPRASTKRFAHMTHSRNASAASCISFASFISEPISEMNEGSNWRVMMDAAEESNLSPPSEMDDSASEKEADGGTESPSLNAPGQDALNRKDSESTVVESKTSAEHADTSIAVKEEKKTSVEGGNSSVELSDKNDAPLSKSSKSVEKTFPTSSADLKRSSTPPIVSNPPDLPEDNFALADSSSIIETLEKSASSSVQDRVSMWLEGSECNIPEINKEDENLTPPHLSQENISIQDLSSGDSSNAENLADDK